MQSFILMNLPHKERKIALLQFIILPTVKGQKALAILFGYNYNFYNGVYFSRVKSMGAKKPVQCFYGVYMSKTQEG